MSITEEITQVLTLWEQGHNKVAIAKMTGLTRYKVTSYIEQYRSLANIEQLTQSNHIFTPPNLKRPHKYTNQELIQAVRQSQSIAETLRALNIRPAGGNYETIKKRIAELKIDTSHFRGQSWSKGTKRTVKTKQSMQEILVENSTYKNTSRLKRRLIEEGYFEAKCVGCGSDEWMGQSIPLEVDHINGNRLDNRIKNLRLLCPNCHALTPTYRGKNIKKDDYELSNS